MEQVFNKIKKGVFRRIPYCYSEALQSLIKSMLSQDPTNRPTCLNIVNEIDSLFLRKPEMKENLNPLNLKGRNLLGTIKTPLDLGELDTELPQPNYNNRKNQGNNADKSKILNINKNSLPEIGNKGRIQ